MLICRVQCLELLGILENTDSGLSVDVGASDIDFKQLELHIRVKTPLVGVPVLLKLI